MSQVDTRWADMAARVVRVILARKGMGYAELATALQAVGVTESERSLALRVMRGRVKLSMLLQILHVTHSTIPRLWLDAISRSDSWEARATAILEAELSRHPAVSVDDLTLRMVQLGASLSEKTLASHIDQGTISLPEFLQCVLALGSLSLDRYIDYDDLIAVGRSAVGERS
ncbi:DUF6471 domain-containing protein [Paraburkholderia caballeronis]|uniref:DUF6471 domain-containing protein n=1 Tax=Paraburkholderia caballeronis TaxID=416943 RepID=A0A1H7SGG9_9BURK|nr:DUF6471 domain-containing protein [Paraburkholderia caballeronis]PXW22300.1 hypothetical protein C7403_11524 [Paraburkholderia caballeronis]PXW95959.1 hypothetical protein C7407_11524 [Paraburkholderia caballeronis]RAJ92325.1 hypothetical protein C7409_11524 [Paraburkholderia caballeronis]TDV27877.1 hypothetical protein C7405_11523 [Paraburkholderia caballeronis]SEB52605.1 hypothetical protein SAMN05445871_0449 [Paraburkholderia caballeronis]